MVFFNPGMSFQIDKHMLQGREQLDFSRAAADLAIVYLSSAQTLLCKKS
jgi:hypothetical protein